MCLRVLDIAHGRPARDLPVHIERQLPEGWTVVHVGSTDQTGSVDDIFSEPAGRGRANAGLYRLTLDCARYFGLQGISVFYREATLTFFLADTSERHVLTVMISPLTFTTCRTNNECR
jgi:5-hydroxyisourate hydrolase-like protein (transthyretin family)